MKIIELAKAYGRLLFPPMPASCIAEDSASLTSFVKEFSRGNISLQNGKFLTRKKHNDLIESLKGYRFNG